MSFQLIPCKVLLEDTPNSGKKKEHKDWLFGSVVPSLESLSFLGFEERNLGCPGNFAGMSQTPGGVQKEDISRVSFARKVISALLQGKVPYKS